MLPASPRHLHWESNLPCLIESSLPVILRRHVWKQSLQAQLMQQGLQMHHLFMRRYVDNRLVLCDSQVSSGDAMREFLHTGFYGSSIELEEVTDHSFLGFQICMSNRTALYQQPTSPWQIQHYNSAGSTQVRTAGLHSRKALILKYSWPPEARKQQVQVLRQMYVDRGFTPTQLR